QPRATDHARAQLRGLDARELRRDLPGHPAASSGPARHLGPVLQLRSDGVVMIDMTLELAETAVKAAQAKARALRAPMTVTVVDESGRLVLSARGDGTGFFSTETSRAEAMAAASLKERTATPHEPVAR